MQQTIGDFRPKSKSDFHRQFCATVRYVRRPRCVASKSRSVPAIGGYGSKCRPQDTLAQARRSVGTPCDRGREASAKINGSLGRITREAYLMEYRGIRYTLRAGIERGQWSVVIYPQGVETTGVKIFGARNDAEDHARRMISRLLDPKSRQRTGPERQAVARRKFE